LDELSELAALTLKYLEKVRVDDAKLFFVVLSMTYAPAFVVNDCIHFEMSD
jgi:hypothetical protein